MIEDTKTYTCSPITEGYVQMAFARIQQGYNADLLTFTFNQLAGSPQSVDAQMVEEIEKVYSRHLTRVIRYPDAPRHAGRLPVWIAAPDFPVPKRLKDNYHDLAVNDGKHWHAVALSPPETRMKGSLTDHFDDNPTLYYGPDRALFRIRGDRITKTPEKVVRYALKSLDRGRIDAGEIMVLPRTRSELSVLTRSERAADRAEL